MGLYYYGARYLDSKYSTWISTDPALGDYIPQAPISDEARKHNQNLPGMGGIFNHINCNLYAYGANNPVRYIDPDGNFLETAWDVLSLTAGIHSFVNNVKKGDVLGAVMDGTGIIADAAAVALPFIPGGAGAAIKAVRTAKAISNGIAGGAQIVSGTTNVVEGIKNGDKLQAVSGLIQSISGTGKIVSSLKTLENMKKASQFFAGTSYSDKVQNQMSKGAGEFHSFPDDVKNFSGDGILETIKGKDGKSYTKLTIPGSYNGKNGYFEFIKDSKGIINHRLFNVE